MKQKANRKSTPKASIPPVDEQAQKPERIAKRMARAGLCSRREAESWIAEGRVRVNGKTLDSPALAVTSKDNIEVDGKPLPGRERTRLWLYHKPAGVLTTNSDPEGRPTLFDRLPANLPRLLSVGRLDMNTEGLLLMTNDGGLARVLELPSTGWLRRYRVRAHGKVEPEKLEELKNGIAVNGVLYGSIEAVVERQQGHNNWLTVAIREGKNREIKNVMGAIGLAVNRLIRVSYGPFQLGELGVGDIVEIRGRTLRDQLGNRLINEAGADFDAPIITQTNPAQVKSRQEAKSDKTKSDKGKAKKTFGKKIARGTANMENMARLTTGKEHRKNSGEQTPDRSKHRRKRK